jgi:hypothetical protein
LAKPTLIAPIASAPVQNTSRDFHNRVDETIARDRRNIATRENLKAVIFPTFVWNPAHEPFAPVFQPATGLAPLLNTPAHAIYAQKSGNRPRAPKRIHEKHFLPPANGRMPLHAAEIDTARACRGK